MALILKTLQKWVLPFRFIMRQEHVLQQKECLWKRTFLYSLCSMPQSFVLVVITQLLR